MTAQSDLFLPPYQRGSPTSKLAALEVRPTAHTMRYWVEMYIVSQGAQGATQREIANALHMLRATLCPRIRELEGWGGRPVKIQKTERVRDRCAVYVSVA